MFHPTKKTLATQLAAAQQRIAELEAQRAAKEASDQEMLGFQVELAGEIMNTIRRTASISRKAHEMLSRMASFDGGLDGASVDLLGIDGQIGGLSESILTTSSAIHQTSAAVEQMSASITGISQESTTRFHDIKNLAELSKSGQVEMTSTLAVITEVTAGIDDLRSFLEIIDDIAGKTSILSMNAAIQAAHAGNVGKGFAVVADEIRRLAESSATNAAGITKKLSGLIEVIHKAETSSRRTSEILTEAEEKVAKAAAGFQEIEQGARELAQGGQEMLSGVSSLRDSSAVMTETAFVIAQNSGAVTAKVSQLRAESKALSSDLDTIRVDSADLNGAGMSLSQTTVNQLGVGRSPQAVFDPTFATILILQHLSWVTRVRAVLDSSLSVRLEVLGDHHACEFGKWLDGPGKSLVPSQDYRALSEVHEAMHHQARSLILLHQTPGRQHEAEEGFPRLVDLSEQVVTALRQLAETLGVQTAFILWSKDFELGNPTIDGQHRRLAELTNRLHAAIRSGQTRAILGGVLDELVEYTVTHFRDEEALFGASRYPDKKAHLDQHQKFIETAHRLQADFRSGRVVLGSETVEFLRDWLLNHIQGSDRGYSKYL
jgi:methyl-accepting chemotaxis protein